MSGINAKEVATKYAERGRKMKRVGVLSFQGGVLEHLNQIKGPWS